MGDNTSKKLQMLYLDVSTIVLNPRHPRKAHNDSDIASLSVSVKKHGVLEPVWVGSGERHPAAAVPRPNLYVGMGAPSLAKVFALTPQGTMGMSDSRVDAGQFDQPGIMGMGSMEGHDRSGMGSMKQADVQPVMTMKDGAHAGMTGMSLEMSDMSMDMSEDSGAAMRPGLHEMKGMTDSASGGVTDPHAQDGKRFGRQFSLLASDVAASPNLAVD